MFDCTWLQFKVNGELACVRVVAICVLLSNLIINIMNRLIEGCIKSHNDCRLTIFLQQLGELRLVEEEDKFD